MLSNISSKTKFIYSFENPSTYQDYVIKPIRKFKEQLIIEQWDTFQCIIASLAKKITSQSTIIKKLSSFKRNNRVRKAIAEYRFLQFVTFPKLRAKFRLILGNEKILLYHINQVVTKNSVGKFSPLAWYDQYNAVAKTYHKLHFIDSPKFQKQVHTALNRGEHINKLRKHYFHANGGKYKVHTMMEQKIWAECNRLLANATNLLQHVAFI